MSLIASRQKPAYRWQKGDLITATEAAELLGFKSAKQFQDPMRRVELGFDFTAVRLGGGQLRFLRSEVDRYITAHVEAAKKLK